MAGQIGQVGLKAEEMAKEYVERRRPGDGDTTGPFPLFNQNTGGKPNKNSLVQPFIPENYSKNKNMDVPISYALSRKAGIFVNGMDTSAVNHTIYAHDLARKSNSTIVGIYNLTEGKLSDIGQCIRDKMFDPHRLINKGNPAIRTLRNIIRWHGIQGRTIWAHSQGAIIVSEALRQAKAAGESIDNCTVITLGGASWTFPKGPEYQHWVHDHDPIPKLFGKGVMPSLPDTIGLHYNGSREGILGPHNFHSYLEDFDRFSNSKKSSLLGSAISGIQTVLRMSNPFGTITGIAAKHSIEHGKKLAKIVGKGASATGNYLLQNREWIGEALNSSSKIFTGISAAMGLLAAGAALTGIGLPAAGVLGGISLAFGAAAAATRAWYSTSLAIGLFDGSVDRATVNKEVKGATFDTILAGLGSFVSSAKRVASAKTLGEISSKHRFLYNDARTVGQLNKLTHLLNNLLGTRLGYIVRSTPLARSLKWLDGTLKTVKILKTLVTLGKSGIVRTTKLVAHYTKTTARVVAQTARKAFSLGVGGYRRLHQTIRRVAVTTGSYVWDKVKLTAAISRTAVRAVSRSLGKAVRSGAGWVASRATSIAHTVSGASQRAASWAAGKAAGVKSFIRNIGRSVSKPVWVPPPALRLAPAAAGIALRVGAPSISGSARLAAFAARTVKSATRVTAVKKPVARVIGRAKQSISSIFRRGRKAQRSGRGEQPDVDAGSLRQEIIEREGSGSPLDTRVRRSLAGYLGFDPAQARIHRGPAAAEAATRMSADAFTIGRDVFFAGNAYDSSSRKGLSLIAHELTHVGQQTGASGNTARFFSQAGGDSMERDAQLTAQKVFASPMGIDGLVVKDYNRNYQCDSDAVLAESDIQRLDRISLMALHEAQVMLARKGFTGQGDLNRVNVDISLDIQSMSDQEAAVVWAQAIVREVESAVQKTATLPSAPAEAVQLAPRKRKTSPEVKAALQPKLSQNDLTSIRRDAARVETMLKGRRPDVNGALAVIAKWQKVDSSRYGDGATKAMDYLLMQLQQQSSTRRSWKNMWIAEPTSSLDSLYRLAQKNPGNYSRLRDMTSGSRIFGNFQPLEELHGLADTSKAVTATTFGITAALGLAMANIGDVGLWAFWKSNERRFKQLRKLGLKIPERPPKISKWAEGKYDEAGSMLMELMKMNPNDNKVLGLNPYEYGKTFGAIPATLAGGSIGKAGTVINIAEMGIKTDDLVFSIKNRRKDGASWTDIAKDREVWNEVCDIAISAAGEFVGYKAGKAHKLSNARKTLKRIGIELDTLKMSKMGLNIQLIDKDGSMSAEDKHREKMKLVSGMIATGMSSVDSVYGEKFDKWQEKRKKQSKSSRSTSKRSGSAPFFAGVSSMFVDIGRAGKNVIRRLWPGKKTSRYNTVSSKYPVIKLGNGKVAHQQASYVRYRQDVDNGHSIYRIGSFDKSSQQSPYWSLESPFNGERIARKQMQQRFSIPPRNVENVDYVHVGRVKPGAEYVVRKARSARNSEFSAPGGGVEVIVRPEDVETVAFHIR